jgi:hypothetical protein
MSIAGQVGTAALPAIFQAETAEKEAVRTPVRASHIACLPPERRKLWKP